MKVSHEADEDDRRDKNEAMTVYIDQHEVTSFSHEVARATTTVDQAVASTTAAGAKQLVVVGKSTSDTGRCSACGLRWFLCATHGAPVLRPFKPSFPDARARACAHTQDIRTPPI